VFGRHRSSICLGGLSAEDNSYEMDLQSVVVWMDLKEDQQVMGRDRRQLRDRRSGNDRRSGVDTRSDEEQKLLGERRSNIDRRSGVDRRVPVQDNVSETLSMTGRQELRKSARRPLRHAAWLTIGDQRRAVPCVVWDISDGGARLAAARHNELPNNFTIVLANSRGERRCEIVWRSHRFLGVRFLR
jgi:hypothetical protein